MKKCNKCGKEKDFFEFGKDLQKFDGLNQYCKECIRNRSKEQRLKNPEYTKEYSIKYREKNRERLRNDAKYTYYRDYEKRVEQAKQSYFKNKEKIAQKRADKRRNQSEKEKNRIRQAEWRQKYKTKAGETVTKWKKNNPQKAAAHALIFWSIRAGTIKRKEYCEECKEICKTEAHHEDYSKPLDIIWLCKNCHSRKHQIYR